MAGDRFAAALRKPFGLKRRRVALAVELDPERELIGQAAIEGDPAALVGAEEPDLSQPVPGPVGDRAEDGEYGERLGGGAQAPPLRLAGEALAALAGGLGGGPAADLGRGQAGGLGAGADQGRALGLALGSGGVDEPEGEGGDVVATAGAVGLVDQGPDRLLHRVGAGEDEADPLLVDHRRQPVRTEQEDVARGRRDGLDVDLDLRLGAEGPGDDRALGVVLGLGVGDLALAPHLLDQRVVAGEAFDLPPAQPVGAAVADVADADLLVGGVDDRGGDRRPHPGQGGVVVRELVDLPVRGLDRRPQERLRAPVGEVAVEGVGRGPRGDLAGLGATHPVGDDEDRGADEERVLVGAPLAAGVGSECLVVDPEHHVTPPRT